MNLLNYIVEELIDVLLGETSNHNFFTYINNGWLKMEFNNLYGDNPSEQECWEWMFRYAETIKLSPNDYNSLIELLDS